MKSRPLLSLCNPAELAWGLIVPAQQSASTAARRHRPRRNRMGGRGNEARRNMMGD
jgi:hypothetical protein